MNTADGLIVARERIKRLGIVLGMMAVLYWQIGLEAAETKTAPVKQTPSKPAAAKPAQAQPAPAQPARVEQKPAAEPASPADPSDAGPAPSEKAPAKPSPVADKQARSDKIQVTADRLVAETKSHFADFIGGVHAVQGDTVITCDRLRVYYDQPKAGDPSQQGAIQKLEADGNVVIHSQEKVAVAPRAVYEMATGVVVLSGPGSRVTEGANTISGDKISLYRNQDRMVVERGSDKRVEAVFFPEKKGAN